jgi:predicted nucleotidyltransferase
MGARYMTLSSGLELPVDRIADICKRYGVRELAVFGSAAPGGLRPESDVDILVDFEPDARIGLVKFASLSEELECLVGRKVDLVTKTGLKPRVRSTVLGEARLVYSA